jgi:hypothetical protein
VDHPVHHRERRSEGPLELVSFRLRGEERDLYLAAIGAAVHAALEARVVAHRHAEEIRGAALLEAPARGLGSVVVRRLALPEAWAEQVPAGGAAEGHPERGAHGRVIHAGDPVAGALGLVVRRDERGAVREHQPRERVPRLVANLHPPQLTERRRLAPGDRELFSVVGEAQSAAIGVDHLVHGEPHRVQHQGPCHLVAGPHRGGGGPRHRAGGEVEAQIELEVLGIERQVRGVVGLGRRRGEVAAGCGLRSARCGLGEVELVTLAHGTWKLHQRARRLTPSESCGAARQVM